MANESKPCAQEALKLFGITMGALKHSNGRVIEANYLLEVERIKVRPCTCKYLPLLS